MRKQSDNRILGDINPKPEHTDEAVNKNDGDRSSVTANDEDKDKDQEERAGTRDVRSGGTGTETGGTRNYRSGSGATGSDIGNRPE